ncbi:hypothetical protein CFOL_v3_26679 [Cephalotus follicularis]|uniref:Uncharacterized protein n=1 Tax=Cephalotus follicularis TaxID=3775 RepID=A0A1Q3CSM3_CEPFO|nr:hypothetical protein CFOL_v3_26679 [Cephalotus follicularis]
MDNITANELAGLGVGTLLLCAAIAAPRVDAFISASQRSSLGMCKRCGDLRMIACSKCKGVGLVKDSGPFSFNLVDDLVQSFEGAESKVKSISCTKCQAKGHFSCPDCSKISQV